MSPSPDPLTSLPGPVFSLGEARAAGFRAARVRRRGLAVPARGVRRRRDASPSSVAFAAALARRDLRLVVSHATAARAWGMWLPQSLEDTVHVTRGAGGAWPRIAGVTGHSTQVPPEHVRTVTDATGTWRLTSPAWTWTDLAAVGMTAEELVIAGDALLQRPVRPKPGDLARHPLSHMDELATLVAARGSIRGVRALRQALPQLRVGVDSPQESRLRLGLEPLDAPWLEEG